MTPRSTLPSLLIAASLGFAPPLALASNDAMQQLIKILHDKGTIDDEAYEALMLASKADEEVNAAAGADVGKKVDQSLAQLGTPALSPGKFEIKDKSGDFAWRTIGRVQYDAALFDNDKAAAQNDAGQFRRVRLGIAGTIATNWKFKAEYDFRELDTGIAGLKDAYINYVGKLPGIDPAKHPVDIKIGQSHEPFSFDLINSSNNSRFVERALPVNAFANFVGERNPGLKVTTWGENWTFGAGVFATRQQETVSDVTCQVPAGGFVPGETFTCKGGQEDTPPRSFGDGYAGTARFTYAPWHDGGKVLHFGSGFSFRDFTDGNSMQLRERFEVNATSTRLIDTGKFAADSFLRWNAELAAVYGPFTFQSEYLMLQAHSAAAGDPIFDGYYVSVGWFLTGESRPYKFQEGIWDSVRPESIVGKGGIGAWELAARYSNADLSDASITGGEEDNVTLGLNWYPAPNLRFMLDYIHVLEVADGKFAGSEPSALVMRSAVFW